MKYIVVRDLNLNTKGSTIVTQYLNTDLAWFCATNSALSATSVEALVLKLRVLEGSYFLTTPTGDKIVPPTSCARIQGPRKGLYNAFTGARL